MASLQHERSWLMHQDSCLRHILTQQQLGHEAETKQLRQQLLGLQHSKACQQQQHLAAQAQQHRISRLHASQCQHSTAVICHLSMRLRHEQLWNQQLAQQPWQQQQPPPEACASSQAVVDATSAPLSQQVSCGRSSLLHLGPVHM